MKNWQIHVAAWGSIFWLASFQASGYAKSHGYDDLYAAISGYVLGFITAFSGYLIKEIISGRGKELLDDHPFWRVLGLIPLFVLIVLGALGFVVEIFGDTSWQYNMLFLVGGFVVAKGVVPLIKHL